MRIYKVKNIKDCPSERQITSWANAFRDTGSLEKKKREPRPKKPKTIESEKKIANLLKEDPLISIRKCARATDTAQSTTAYIMKDLKENDKEIRRKVHLAEKKRAGGVVCWGR